MSMRCVMCVDIVLARDAQGLRGLVAIKAGLAQPNLFIHLATVSHPRTGEVSNHTRPTKLECTSLTMCPKMHSTLDPD